MYIAVNRFKVMKGAESAFEHVWLSRDTHLDHVPGFLEFHLLRGPERDDHMLYSSHTVWASKDAFTAWTQSERFAPPTVTPAASRSISVILSLRASRSFRRSRTRGAGSSA